MQCNTANPHFEGETYASDAAAAAMAMFAPLGDGTVECAQCGYIHIGSYIQSVCY
jgi:hypothetical protein